MTSSGASDPAGDQGRADPAADLAFEVLSAAGGRVTRNAPLGPYTTYQLGGPALLVLEAKNVDDLALLSEALDRSGLPLLVVGRGSNLLISDRGFPGIALRLGRPFRASAVDGSRISAGAAYPLPGLATLALEHSLSGLEFSVAIPGSFGGALVMNAGAHGRCMADIVREVKIFDMRSRAERSVPVEEAGYGYRSSRLPAASIVTGGTVELTQANKADVAKAMRDARRWRRATQPMVPNAGSVFKNPPGDAAGRLVDQICGKGMRVGGARVSEIHANFIVTEPGARAADVLGLIRRIQTKVFAEAGVSLELELRLVGEFEESRDAG